MVLKGTNTYENAYLQFRYKLNHYLDKDGLEVYKKGKDAQEEYNIPSFFEPYREFVNEATFIILDDAIIHLYALGALTVGIGIWALIWHFMIERMCWYPLVKKYCPQKEEKVPEPEKSSESSYEEEIYVSDKEENSSSVAGGTNDNH